MDDIIPSLLYGLMWLSIGIATIINAWRAPAKVRKLPGWKKAKGHIAHREVIQELDDEGDPIYVPVVRYEYYVGGLNFSIEKTTFDPHSARDDSSRDMYWNEQKALRSIKRYKKDRAVNVYYNPSNLREAILDDRPMSTAWNFSAILFIIYGVYILYSCLIHHSCMDIVTIIED
ncbi:MAG: DUF3592 domain-containing protein [Anaerolineales bacterium]|nr:DUF3592 domain-containing protein [Anaerolineales bacterium]